VVVTNEKGFIGLAPGPPTHQQNDRMTEQKQKQKLQNKGQFTGAISVSDLKNLYLYINAALEGKQLKNRKKK
jgi:hypothetical protein